MTVQVGRYLAVLDIGHGNCSVLKDTNGIIVVDTGLGTSLLEFLSQNSIKHIDIVLLSHADQDHISGLVQLLASNAITIGQVRLNTDSAKTTRLWRNLVYELEKQEISGKLNWTVALTADSGENFSQGKVDVEVLAPGKALAALGPGNKTNELKEISTNTVSCVIRLSQDNQAIAVLPGDIDDVGLEDLKRRLDPQRKSLQAPILIYPHHGGLNGGCLSPAQFAELICDVFQPQTVVFSIGRGKHGTPRPEVVEAIRRKVSNVRIACTQLSEHCSKTSPDAAANHLLPFFAQGRQDGACCAGTMVIDLDSSDDLKPSLDSHNEFISQFAGQALCLRPLR